MADVVEVGKARVDIVAKTVSDPDGQRIHLTPTEWRLLEALGPATGPAGDRGRC